MRRNIWFGAVLSFLLTLAACTETTETTQIVLQRSDDSPALNAMLVSPYNFEESIEVELNPKPPRIVIKAMDKNRSGYPWLISKVSDGKFAYTETAYRTTYDFQGNVLSKDPVPNSEVVYDEVPEIHQYGARVERGAYFFARVITRYGYDCVGCVIALDGTAGTSAGIRLNGTHVRQSDGTWKEGITYDGFYIFAADRAYPHCTIVEITNHPFSGMGLLPGVPFRGIIVDRGSAITTNKLDLFSGSERRLSVATIKNTVNTKVTVVGFLQWTRNSQGHRICR
jgi:3D (Asp-Asp-Asp) domain-containing protein